MRALVLALALGACSTAASAPGDAGTDAARDAAREDARGQEPLDAARPPQKPHASNGFPCDVDDVLDTACRACHGEQVRAGLIAFLRREDALDLAPGGTDTVLDRSLRRMRDPVDRMPPNRAATATEIGTLAAWADAGAPAFDGTCLDGRALDGGATDARRD